MDAPLLPVLASTPPWVWVVAVVLGGMLLLAMLGPSPARLMSEPHLREIHGRLLALKTEALAHPCSEAAPLAAEAVPNLRTDAPMVLTYSVVALPSIEGGGWGHHLAMSNGVTPAIAASTFVLAYIERVLGLDIGALDGVTVSPNGVFHLSRRLDDAQHALYQTAPLAAHEAAFGPSLLAQQQVLVRHVRTDWA